ncbi:hypothetical protein [Bradyrhizobium sp.]|uniref:hypothetical protein n=1 Tax=Bradyrhizobium sp. TaxID=376 RepID=UPI0040383A48
MEGTKYGPIFLGCVIVGAILVFVPPNGIIAGGQFVYFGMKGLLVEQQIAKGEIEFGREYQLREQEERFRQAEHERQLRLRRPALPEEGS